MSPRKPAVLRDGDGDGPSLREYLIGTAARLIAERGSAGLSVRDIARDARVADGALYNYFEDKEDLLAQALLAHVGSVMQSVQQMPAPGTGTVAGNLRLFIDRGLAVLVQLMPAFAGLLAQPKVLSRFHAMVGGDAAFGTATADDDETTASGGAATAGGEGRGADRRADYDPGGHDPGGHDPGGHDPGGHDPGGHDPGGHDPGEGDPGMRGLPELLTRYLCAEQELGRIDAAADVEAAATLIVGAMHGQVLPRVLLSPPGTPVTTPPGLSGRLAETVLRGIAPGGRGG